MKGKIAFNRKKTNDHKTNNQTVVVSCLQFGRSSPISLRCSAVGLFD